MKVVDKFPPTNIERRPPCEAQLSRYVVEVNNNWTARGANGGQNYEMRKRKGLDQDHCGLNSRYLIDGGYYCRKHAAFYVLDVLVAQGDK